MSAIFKYPLKIFFSTFVLLIFFSCQKTETKTQNNSEPITSISLSYIGGSAGNYKIIKVTKDSIHAERGNTTNNVHQQKSLTLDPKAWKQLIASFDVKNLDKIKSSASIQSLDGIDETFQIKTPKKSYIYVNSYNDTIHYGQLQRFKDQLEKVLPKEYR
ncbi:hypothetical protein MUU74_08710 [Chryseobacterium daecheongense]|uniref:hypothetical protein n=1 Tax=Chryseobacterium daecheongense TaxID=192389 RepID=UPI001FD69A7C|nr:hypothetical protein [Chryseobacterium daecheongense]UOV00023.1 hypothetical protein MUU74_08710 [Chryseobacterium daecheongense]